VARLIECTEGAGGEKAEGEVDCVHFELMTKGVWCEYGRDGGVILLCGCGELKFEVRQRKEYA